MRGKRVPAVAHGGFDVTKVRPGPEFRALRVRAPQLGETCSYEARVSGPLPQLRVRALHS